MSTRTTPASLFNQTRSRFENRPSHKDVKNADRSEEVYENKGHHDKLPEKKSDFVSETTEVARNFGVFARNFAGYAHENRSGEDSCRHLARQTRRYIRCEARRARRRYFVPCQVLKTKVHPAMLLKLKERYCARPQTSNRMAALARQNPSPDLVARPLFPVKAGENSSAWARTAPSGEGRSSFLTMFMKTQTLLHMRQIFVAGKRLMEKDLFSGRRAAGEKSGNRKRRKVSRCY